MRGDIWQRAVKRHTLPHLPSSWKIKGNVLYRVEPPWLLHYITRSEPHSGSTWSTLTADVQFLPIPSDFLIRFYGERINSGPHAGQWPNFSTLDESAAVMPDITAAIIGKAIPFLDQSGSLTAISEETAKRAQRDPQDIRAWEAMAYIAIIQDQIDHALQYFSRATAVARTDTSAWGAETVARLNHVRDITQHDCSEALEVLANNAQATLTALRL